MRYSIRRAPSAREVNEAARRSLDEFQQFQHRRRARADGDKFAAIGSELKAAREGRELGARYAGDPWRCARVMGIPVSRVNAAALTARFGRGRGVMGCWSVTTREIFLADDLGPRMERKVLAHELGHRFGHGAANDAVADTFAAAFIRETPEHPAFAQARAREAWAQRLRRAAR